MIWRTAAVVCAIALAASLVLLVRHWRETAPPPPPLVRVAFAAPPGTELGVGDEVLDAAISPDGREIAFVATANGITRLWRRSFDTENAEALTLQLGMVERGGCNLVHRIARQVLVRHWTPPRAQT